MGETIGDVRSREKLLHFNGKGLVKASAHNTLIGRNPYLSDVVNEASSNLIVQGRLDFIFGNTLQGRENGVLNFIFDRHLDDTGSVSCEFS